MQSAASAVMTLPRRLTGEQPSVNSDRLRVGLVGCGWIARIAHIPSLGKSSFGQLVAVADPAPGIREGLGLPAGVVVRSSLDELLELDDADAIVIAAPTAQHAGLARSAFAARKHVYLEKPLATSPEDGRQVVEAWRRAGTAGTVGFNFRHSRLIEAARTSLTAGELGELVGIQTRFLWAADTINGWRASLETGGGVLPDLASHHIDLVTAITGERITGVRCETRSLRTPEDTAVLHLVTESGILVQTLVSFAAGAQVNEVELVGRRAALSVNLLDALPRPARRPPGPMARVARLRRALEELHPARLVRSPGHEPTFATSLESFLKGARDGRSARPTPLDGLHVLEVVSAARRSAAEGGVPILVDEVGAFGRAS